MTEGIGLEINVQTVGVDLQKLMDMGAIGALMTGTGSAVFGLFEDLEGAKKCVNTLSQDYRECYWAEPKSALDV